MAGQYGDEVGGDRVEDRAGRRRVVKKVKVHQRL